MPGEGEQAAALRELQEETGVESVELLAEARGWLSYDLPSDLLGIALKGRYRGQRQKWFAMRFTGPESEIDIAPRGGHKAEFDAWRWASPAELPHSTTPFKRQLYCDVMSEFAAFVG
jgi:putative (di)nucleoside polyphosphate hydrolase